MYRRLILLSAVALSLPVRADPLFESDQPLAFELAGPFRTMSIERDKTKEYPGRLVLGGKVFNVDLSMRGNRRLDKSVCENPPLRLDFKKKEIKDTVFDKQDDIKLVVQCGNSGRFLDYLRSEFLIYRAFNLVTNANYRVRWVTVTYHDSERPGRDRIQPAFFVERKSRLAKRLGLDTTRLDRVNVSQLDPYQAVLVALFEYMVANPDYSILVGPPGEECCHNAKLLETKNHAYVPVIYDFDNTGVVNARYAVPPAGLRIRSVTQRLYRGYCAQNGLLARAKDALVEHEAPILKLFDEDPILSKWARRSTTRFLTTSFDIFEDSRQFDRQVVGQCRG